ncbi:hypothetical protein BJV74DRAFT_867569 [Russula compacta]|nr:hypothetical protein BJV74DRAFT_867569 [Russula compacta]
MSPNPPPQIPQPFDGSPGHVRTTSGNVSDSYGSPGIHHSQEAGPSASVSLSPHPSNQPWPRPHSYPQMHSPTDPTGSSHPQPVSMSQRAQVPVNHLVSSPQQMATIPGQAMDSPSAWPTTGTVITDNPYDDGISREEDSFSPRNGSTRAKGEITLPWLGNARSTRRPQQTTQPTEICRHCQRPASTDAAQRLNGFCSDLHMWDAIRAGRARLCSTCRQRACRDGFMVCCLACEPQA